MMAAYKQESKAHLQWTDTRKVSDDTIANHLKI